MVKKNINAKHNDKYYKLKKYGMKNIFKAHVKIFIEEQTSPISKAGHEQITSLY